MLVHNNVAPAWISVRPIYRATADCARRSRPHPQRDGALIAAISASFPLQ